MKYKTTANNYVEKGRTPHGVRGLKSLADRTTTRGAHPSRGVWIEMRQANPEQYSLYVAPLTGCVD